MKPLDLKKLHHAVTLEKESNFLRASERLHLTQSALTRSIQSLESDLGLKLFERDRSGVKPTTEGKVILAKARQLLLQSGTVRREVELIRLAERGNVAFGVGPAMAGVVLPDLFAALGNHHSRVSVTTEIDSPENLVSSLLDEKIEFFVGSTNYFDTDTKNMGIAVQTLCRMSTGIYTRSGHPLANRRNIDIRELEPYPLLLANLGQEQLGLLRSAYGHELDIENIKYMMCNAFEALKFAALNSHGVLVTLRETITEELAAGSIRELDMIRRPPVGQLHINLVTVEGRSLSLAGQRVLDLIQDVLNRKGAPLAG